MIPIGIFAKTFIRTDVDAVFKAVQEYGFTVTHFNYACAGLPALPDEISDHVATAIRTAANLHGVRIAGVSATFNMIHPDPEERREGLERLETIVAACSAVGSDLVTLCTGTRDPDDKWAFHPDNNSPAAWKDLTDSMEKALLIAEKYQIQLGVEPEAANVVNSTARARQLLSEMQSPQLKIVLDPANLFTIANEDEIKDKISQAIDQLGPAIAMAHAKDRNTEGRTVAPGRGIIPFEFLIETLTAAGIHCPLIAHGFSEHEASFVLQYLKQF